MNDNLASFGYAVVGIFLASLADFDADRTCEIALGARWQPNVRLENLARALCGTLSLPLIAAPMFLVSGVDLVVEACGHGIIGSFPTANCRNAEQLDSWQLEIAARLRRRADEVGVACAPSCPNLIVHRSNARRATICGLCSSTLQNSSSRAWAHRAPLLARFMTLGRWFFADVASLRHAERAVQAGADGLVLLTAGGGQTGWLNRFAFTRAVRRFFSGPIVLAGGISDGRALRAARTLGCDFAYMGTRFIAAHESMADQRYKDMLVASSADDIVLMRAFTGLQTNMLRQSIVTAGLDPDSLPAERGDIEISKDIDIGAREAAPARWRHLERRPLDVRCPESVVGGRSDHSSSRGIPGGMSRRDRVISLVRH